MSNNFFRLSGKIPVGQNYAEKSSDDGNFNEEEVVRNLVNLWYSEVENVTLEEGNRFTDAL